MVEKAVLFDVQDTIVREAKDVSQYYFEAIRSSYGLSLDNIKISDYKDHTVQETLADILSKQGLTKSEIYEKHELFLEELPYAHYNVAGHDKAILVDGAKEILNRLGKKDDIVVGAATGQLERILRNMFDRVELNYDHYFRFGAYGDVSESIAKIVDVAIAKAVKEYGIERKHISFVSCSTRLVAEAHSTGVNAICIVKEHHTKKELEEMRGGHLAKSLRDCEKFIV